MTKMRPVCDRHKNMQMVPCSRKTTTGKNESHICPVPGCGRRHNDQGYFDGIEAKPSAQINSQTNRREAARAAILKAIEERRPAEPRR